MKRSPSPKSVKPRAAPKKAKAHSAAAPVTRVEALAQLVDAQLVRRLDESEAEYIFKHALTQESAYQSLLNRTRRDIHLDVARVYEELYPNRLDENAALLAQHYAEGGEERKALEYATRAGDVATRVYANAEAIMEYTRAMELAARVHAEGAQVTHLYLQRGRLYELKGQYELALDDYHTLHSLARERSDRAMELASVMATLPIYATPTSAHDPEMAKMLADRALTLARDLGDRGAESKILWSLMLFMRWTGEPIKALEFGEASLAIAREHNLSEQMAYTLNDLGVHGYMELGQYRQGLDSLKQAQVLWRQANNLPMLADSYGGIALLSYSLGRYDDVLAASGEAQRISESIENLWGQSYARWITPSAYSDRGEPAQAIAVAQEAVRLGGLAGFTGADVGVRVQWGTICSEYGMPERGIVLASEAVEIARANFESWRPWARAAQARVFVRVGKIAEAAEIVNAEHSRPTLAYLARVLALYAFHLELARAEIALARKDQGYDPASLDHQIDFLIQHEGHALLPELHLMQARVFALREDFVRAYAALTRAREIAEPIMHRRVLWQIYGTLAELEVRRGNMEAARALRDQARTVVDYIAAHATEEQRTAFLQMAQVRQVMQ